MEDTRRPKGHLGGHGRVPDAAPLGPAGGARPCPLGIASAPSDAYKIPFNLKTMGSHYFPRTPPEAAAISKPNLGRY